jgi:hypothetical protein
MTNLATLPTSPVLTPLNLAPLNLAQTFDALAAGNAQAALASCVAPLLLDPKQPDWLTAKALALSALREPLLAAEIYRQLIALQPSVPEHHANLGNALLELAHPAAAFSALQAAQALGFSDASLHFGLARAAFELGEVVIARSEVVLALKNGLDQDIEVGLFYLKCLIALDESDLAKDNVQRLMQVRMPPDFAVEFALLVLQLSDFAGVERITLAIPTDAPEYLLAQINLALSYERANKMPQALAIRQSLADHYAAAKQAGLGASSNAPDQSMHGKIEQALIQLDARFAARDKDFASVKVLLGELLAIPTLEAGTRIALEFELARALDSLREHDAAFTVLEAVHARRYAQVAAAHPNMARENDPLMLLDQHEATLPNTALHDTPHADARLDPVFVVGFPRSGTTLLEQLLDAHPALQSFDEQPFLQKCILKMQGMGLSYPAELGRLTAAQIAALRTHYFALCAQVSPQLAPAARYVDKNPLNLARLPLIQTLFPAAKVIVVLRHPADCVLSCYMQHFRAPAFALAMRTLKTTAELYHRVFDFYRTAAPKLSVARFELKYEHFVSDLEPNARALIEFLALPWHSELLNFTERAKTRAISTPSYAAVTEAVNRRAVARHRAYENQFEAQGAAGILGEWVAFFGYDDA